jgi:hypothetical protein
MGIYSLLITHYLLLITHYLKKETIVHEFFTPEKVQSQQPTPNATPCSYHLLFPLALFHTQVHIQ